MSGAWVIRHADGYIDWASPVYWTSLESKAERFASREDAERAIKVRGIVGTTAVEPLSTSPPENPR